MPNKKLQIRNSTAEFLIFTSLSGENGIEIRVENETIWLSQKMIAILFDCSTDNISLHLKNIFKTSELAENAVTEDFSVTAADGKNYKTTAELIMNRADSKKERMGLTTWKNAPSGKIVKTDVVVAKNYLNEKEIKNLERFVTM